MWVADPLKVTVPSGCMRVFNVFWFFSRWGSNKCQITFPNLCQDIFTNHFLSWMPLQYFGADIMIWFLLSFLFREWSHLLILDPSTGSVLGYIKYWNAEEEKKIKSLLKIPKQSTGYIWRKAWMLRSSFPLPSPGCTCITITMQSGVSTVPQAKPAVWEGQGGGLLVFVV